MSDIAGNPRLFGTSGIRRKADELTDDFIYDLGRALGTYTADAAVVVGRDTRKSGPRLELALVSGILSTGRDVVLLGIVPTPVVGFASMDYGTGVMITASHNPPEYNGFKFWGKKGAYTAEQEKALEDIFYSKKFVTGRKGAITEKSYIESYIQKVLEYTGKVKRKVKVFLDCANGAGATVTPRLLERMGCVVVSVNTELEGEFPHGLEPREENLREICALVKESGAEVGIVHDGDADRSAAIDRDGRLVDWDSFLAVLAYGRDKVVTTVDASMRIEDVCNEVVRTPVGDVAVANAIVRENADFGGEPSGSYIFPEVHLFPDGPLTAAVVAKMVSEDRFYKILSGIKTYPTKRLKIPCREEDKKKIMEKLTSVIKESEYGGRLDLTDGLRISMVDGWVLLRPSGTESFMRITAEARSRERLEEIVDEARKWLVEAMG
ncbi:MAG: phosphoglucosamine mutase [Candidatus Altiarchaeota archaeon]|nr:phosphoglucosamine mutase [Candidatus Altiarchaeota archaeon]